MERLIHVLMFSGLCLFIQGMSCQYVLIQKQMIWDEAQVYCRQNQFDLATVQSNEDWTNVQRAVGPVLTSTVWIGLYNDINSWRWSNHNETMTFVLWNLQQPDNRQGTQECIRIEFGEWYDGDCDDLHYAFCYNEVKTGADRFVYITDIRRTWYEAQSYCRQHYTDLATIRTQAENDLLPQVPGRVWIGLFRDSWKWSDGTNVSMSPINWMFPTRDITGQTRPCGAAGPDGRIKDQDCSTALPFICKQHSKKQIVKLEVKSGQNLKDTAVMETLLQWIKQKLKDRGIDKDTTLTWRLQADGNVFTPKHDAEEINDNQAHCSEFLF